MTGARKAGVVIVATVIASLAAMASYRLWPPGPPQAKIEASGSTRVNAHELHFPADAPQLNFIRAEIAEALPQPLLDPLNARITYDENHTARVASPINGRVVRIFVQAGDRIAAGQPLIALDAPEFAAAAADVAKAKADYQLRQKAYARASDLFAGGVIARKEVETSESELRQSEAEHMRASLRLRNLSASADAGGATYTLRSPISGVVAERSVNPGGEIRPDAQTPLFVITDSSHLWVTVDLPERNLDAMRVGQDVVVEVDAYPGERFPAKVASVAEVLDPATRRVQVRCTLANPKRLLKPEMYARVTPLADGHAKLPRIPNAALITEGLFSYVFVEKETGRFEKRKVALGLQGRSESYVREGLANGERVVAVGALLLNAELAGIE